jgi:hypothetical protein
MQDETWKDTGRDALSNAALRYRSSRSGACATSDTASLGERIKELEVLHQMARFLQNEEKTAAELLQERLPQFFLQPGSIRKLPLLALSLMARSIRRRTLPYPLEATCGFHNTRRQTWWVGSCVFRAET